MGLPGCAATARMLTALSSTLPSFANSFKAEQLEQLLDIFTSLSSPAAPKLDASQIELAGSTYTLSGPRGAQHPLEMATLHSDAVSGLATRRAQTAADVPRFQNVLFVTLSATLMVVFEAAAGADTKEKTPAKEALYSAVRSFTTAITEKGV